MSSGLVALLDDIATLAKAAATSIDDLGIAAGKASAKAAGVVVDDTAVTPQYVRGVAAKRELPLIGKIALGSLGNKLLVILPAALLLSQFLPWFLTPILMLGGTYLCFEGAEKIWEKVGSHHEEQTLVAAEIGPEQEKVMVKSAITTDFILSAEIMVISLKEVADEPFVRRLLILVVVALVITAAVYGIVAFIVKMDDIGLRMTQLGSASSKRIGELLVKAMPKLLAVISVVGTAAMLWVGGHLLLVGFHDMGEGVGGMFGKAMAAPYTLVHHWEESIHHVAGIGPFLAWLVDTAASALAGLAVGAIVVAVVALLPLWTRKQTSCSNS